MSKPLFKNGSNLGKSGKCVKGLGQLLPAVLDQNSLVKLITASLCLVNLITAWSRDAKTWDFCKNTFEPREYTEEYSDRWLAQDLRETKLKPK